MAFTRKNNAAMPDCSVRKAEMADYGEICGIYRAAREFMASCGNMSQWQNVPQLLEDIKKDISQGNFYICEEKQGGKILAAFCFFIGNDPTYYKIYGGSWLNSNEYGIIHRIASAEKGRGIAGFCIDWCLKQHGNIKIDTHKDNIPMQKTIAKSGFKYCGIIKKADGTERLAYQKTYKEKQ